MCGWAYVFVTHYCKRCWCCCSKKKGLTYVEIYIAYKSAKVLSKIVVPGVISIALLVSWGHFFLSKTWSTTKSVVLLVVLKWIWNTCFWPSIAKISGGISCRSSDLCFWISSKHEYPVMSSAAGVKKVTGTVADASLMKALKLNLRTTCENYKMYLSMFWMGEKTIQSCV